MDLEPQPQPPTFVSRPSAKQIGDLASNLVKVDLSVYSGDKEGLINKTGCFLCGVQTGIIQTLTLRQD